MNKTDEKEVRAHILATLEELGGKLIGDDDVTYEGMRFVIPERMTASDALEFLERHVEQQEEETSFSKVFDYRPWDGAHAFQAAVKKITGTTGIGRPTYTFFGKNPPQLQTINVGPNQTEQVPWGKIEVPVFKGYCYLDSSKSKEHGPLFNLTIVAARKFRHAAEGLFRAVEEELRSNSIYRGRAIDGGVDPDFKDTSVVDPDQLVFSQQVLADLGAQLWWPIEDIGGVKGLGLRTKRAILLEGAYGTGKTETANLTAKKCEEHGWTFIQVRSNKDNLTEAMATARLYQPAVVFFEDVDIVTDSENRTSAEMSQLLDLFDGMDAKHTDIMVVLTTNHVDRIHKGMLRPGRLDGIIHLGGLDRDGVERLAHIQLGTERVKDVDFDQVFKAMEGYTPAFVARALAKAVEYSRGSKTYTTEQLVNAAGGLRSQHDLYIGAGETKKTVSFVDDLVVPAVGRALEGARLVDSDGAYAGPPFPERIEVRQQ